MKYDLEISFHDYEKELPLVYAEDLYISDIIEIIKQYPLNPCYRITIKPRQGGNNNGHTK